MTEKVHYETSQITMEMVSAAVTRIAVIDVIEVVTDLKRIANETIDMRRVEATIIVRPNTTDFEIENDELATRRKIG